MPYVTYKAGDVIPTLWRRRPECREVKQPARAVQPVPGGAGAKPGRSLLLPPPLWDFIVLLVFIGHST